MHRLIAFASIICGCILCINNASAQKYTFTHYDIESGLIQSQVNKLYQDNSHRIWMATLGGACRFDGVDYYAISKATGLINNFIYTVFCDRKGTVWFGTEKGLSCLKNNKVYNLKSPVGLKSVAVTRITEDAAGTVWGVIGNRLFKVSGNHTNLVKVSGLSAPVTTVTVNQQGRLFAGVFGVGVFSLDGNVWKKFIMLPQPVKGIYVSKIVFDKRNPGKTFLLAYKGVFVAEKDTVTEYEAELLKKARRPFLAMELDADNDVWIGTANGAYYLNNNKLVHFDAGNGFTDVAVSDIYNDSDNNLWLGTQGNGAFKYDGDDYVLYGKSDEFKDNPIVMGLARDGKGDILLGIDGGGLALYNGQTIKSIWLHPDNQYARKVQFLYTDHTGNVWIGTSMGGIWRYDGKQVTLLKGTENNSVTAIVEDDEGTIWLATPSGLYYCDRQLGIHSAGVSIFASSLLAAGKDSLFLGTQEGVKLLVNKKMAPGFKVPLMGTSALLCMLKYKDFIILGTDDQGIYIWNRKTGRVRNFQVKDGFKSNSIYSLAVDGKGLIWAGTGRGVSRFFVNERSMDCIVLAGNETKDRIIESNQNAILLAGDKMLVGTTKGLAVYNTTLSTTEASPPHIIINSIKLFTPDNSSSSQIADPGAGRRVILSSSQNHLAISFLGVYLKSPANVSYQYRLTGLDDKFCWPVKNNVVDYPSLPPGKYTFEVKAISGDGLISKNTATFNFEITPPFYRTYIFQLAVILVLIFIGVVLQNLWHQRKIQQQRALEAMKREEKLKIRQQTAEDFHDDLGNKLTRITVLSDILDAKLENDKTEQRNLVLQIKQNAAALYNGTRDILWAMDPKSDNLYEVLYHIREIGIEIFQDTEVNFRFGGISDEQAGVKLPMEYSRNITMIFKELLNNVLKHADAKNVKVEFVQIDKGYGKLQITDDGTGFDTATVNKGHGLNNIRSRAKRIGAQIAFVSGKETGTTAELTFNTHKKT